MGKGSSRESTVVEPQPVQIPPELAPLIRQAAANIMALQRQYPLQSIMGNLAQQITPVTPEELALISDLIGYSRAPAMSAPEFAALRQIGLLTGGPIGSSPATLAGLDAFEDLQRPAIEQDVALAGLSKGGAFPETLAQERTRVLQPLIEQEIQNRMGVLMPLSGIGATVADRERADVETALQGANIPRSVADAQNLANWQDVMRRAGIIETVNLGIPSQLFPGLIPPAGQITTGRTSRPGIWTSLGKKVWIVGLFSQFLA